MLHPPTILLFHLELKWQQTMMTATQPPLSCYKHNIVQARMMKQGSVETKWFGQKKREKKVISWTSLIIESLPGHSYIKNHLPNWRATRFSFSFTISFNGVICMRDRGFRAGQHAIWICSCQCMISTVRRNTL